MSLNVCRWYRIHMGYTSTQVYAVTGCPVYRLRAHMDIRALILPDRIPHSNVCAVPSHADISRLVSANLPANVSHLCPFVLEPFWQIHPIGPWSAFQFTLLSFHQLWQGIWLVGQAWCWATQGTDTRVWAATQSVTKSFPHRNFIGGKKQQTLEKGNQKQ